MFRYAKMQFLIGIYICKSAINFIFLIEGVRVMQQKILVVDDAKSIVDILKFNLKREGFNVLVGYDGEEAIEIVHKENPDLIILDIMMPKLDGLQACKMIRKEYDTPIIMLTARAEEVDKVIGLELGADDYVTKPFSVRELMARVKANLRRSSYANLNGDGNEQAILEFDEMKIDLNKYEVTKDDEIINLTLREFELLKFMVTQKEQIFTREQLLEKVWGYEYYGDVRTVDVTVRRLREKIEEDPSKPRYILTKRGVGYYFKSR